MNVARCDFQDRYISILKYFRVKKIDLETQIREVLQKQKKTEEEKNPQKEIDSFLVRYKCDSFQLE